MENFQDRGVWIRIRFVLRGWIRIQIRFVLRGWIRIRSISDRIRNPAEERWELERVNERTNRRAKKWILFIDNFIVRNDPSFKKLDCAPLISTVKIWNSSFFLDISDANSLDVSICQIQQFNASNKFKLRQRDRTISYMSRISMRSYFSSLALSLCQWTSSFFKFYHRRWMKNMQGVH